MSKVQNPIIGRTRGQAGGMVFAKMYDKNVMRSRPFQVRDANTAAQQGNRAVVSAIAKYVKAFTPSFLIRIFPIAPTSHSRYSAILKALQTMRTTNGPTGGVDFSKKLPFGSGLPCALSAPSANCAAGIVVISWEFLENAYSGPNDTVCIIVFNETRQDTLIVEDADVCNSLDTSFTLPLGWQNGDRVFAAVACTVHKEKLGTECSEVIM